MIKKHGIYVKEHKKWNTKTIWNNGHIMRVYRHCPKVINFQSPMVNDFNQHLCGGWTMKDIKNGNGIIIQRVVDKLKPFGVSLYSNEEECRKKVSELERLNLSASMIQKKIYKNILYDLTVCQKGTLDELFDLKVLLDDYRKADIDITEDLGFFKDYDLCKFFKGWSEPMVPICITGLILGYPIENTISIYKQY